MRRSVLVMFLGVPLLFGVLALFLGHDSNWDLRNYHWYNAYAALNGRMDVDMGVAQTPTFYNPTLDIPFFLAADALPAKVYSFLLGVLQGCNFILLYMIAMRTLRFGSLSLRTWASMAIALAGMIGGGNISQVGAAFYDNIVSLFVFAGIVVILENAAILREGPMRPALLRVAGAGVLVGLGVGLKLPTQIFAVGVCFGLLFVPGPFVRRFFLSFVCGLGIIAGFMVTGAWWMWELWTHYANPLFPYFNDIFKSPWGLPFHYRDDRYLPKTLVDTLVLPFRIFVDPKVSGEIAFRDARILSAYVILIATAAMLLLKRFEKTESANAPYADVFAVRYLAAAFALSYVVWLKLFSIYRYMLPLEMLAPILVVGCMAFWPVRRTRQLALAIGVLGFMVITAQPGTWGRIPWADGLGRKLVDVTPPPIPRPTETMIIMTGFAPTSFAVPAFPSEIPFLRIHSFLLDPRFPTRFSQIMQQRIAAHTGDFFLLRADWEKWPADELLPLFGLALTPDACRPLPANLDHELELCGLTKTAPQSP